MTSFSLKKMLGSLLLETQMIKLRPHHLLDIMRDYGNDIKRKPHPWGASLKYISEAILENPHLEIEFVLSVDSICETCDKLNQMICEASINDDLLMRDYNDPLDQKLFEQLGIPPNTRMSLIEFSKIIRNNMSILNLFTSPTQDINIRIQGTKAALNKLGIPNAT